MSEELGGVEELERSILQQRAIIHDTGVELYVALRRLVERCAIAMAANVVNWPELVEAQKAMRAWEQVSLTPGTPEAETTKLPQKPWKSER